MQKTATYTHDDVSEIEALLLGRRIVQAEMGDFDYPGRERWDDKPQGRLVLDDGTVVYLAGNEGGCACSAGDYALSKVAAVDNIITNVRVEASPDGDDFESDAEGTYRIFVFADATEINVAEFVGTDGNGYYGTGFWLVALRPEGPSHA